MHTLNPRQRIYEIIEAADGHDRLSRAYDFIMIDCIILSLLPLIFKTEYESLVLIDHAIGYIFLLDYFLRLITADYKLGLRKKSFYRYPFTFMAVIDLLSILPSFLMLNHAFRLFKILRLLRILRIFKAFRYSKSVTIITRVFAKERDPLLAVAIMTVCYVLTISIVIFNVEPDTFDSFFDALYWAIVSLTTVGYGDIYAVSKVGKVITMISSLLGIVIIALPSGIITAGYMEELQEEKEMERERKRLEAEKNNYIDKFTE